MEIRIEEKKTVKKSTMQLFAETQLQEDEPNFSDIDFRVFDENFHISNIFGVKNKEAWTKWFFSIYTSKNTNMVNQIDHVNTLFVEKGTHHLLSLCFSYDNWFFFSSLMQYIYFMEEKRNHNLKKLYKAIHFSTNHTNFANHSFENFLFSYYNKSPIVPSFINTMHHVYPNIVSAESLTFI